MGAVGYSKKGYEVGRKFTVGELLDHIYKFYAGEIPEEELEAISNKTSDGWGYSDQAKKSLEEGTYGSLTPPSLSFPSILPSLAIFSIHSSLPRYLFHPFFPPSLSFPSILPLIFNLVIHR